MPKTLILPVAVIASGKSSLGRLLEKLNIAHIQSDDVKAKKPAPIFISKCIEAFKTHEIVYADKNNHLPMHRFYLSTEFKRVYPDGIIICLQWDIDQMNRNELANILSKRIEKRGEDHQTLTPLKTPHYRNILNMFLKDWRKIDLNGRDDGLIDVLVLVPFSNSPEMNLELVKRSIDYSFSLPKIVLFKKSVFLF